MVTWIAPWIWRALVERGEGSRGGETSGTTGDGRRSYFDMGSGGGTGERNRTHSDGGAWGRNGWLVMDITLAGFGKTGRNAALKVSDDVWRRMTVESRMSWRSVSGGK